MQKHSQALFVLLGCIAGSNLAASPFSGRVVGGQDTNIDAIPATVAVLDAREYQADAAPMSFEFQTASCGGTLIQAQWVLTAAHCLTGISIGDLAVLAGSSDLQQPLTAPVYAEAVYIHPEYNALNKANDIALIKLPQSTGQALAALYTEDDGVGSNALVAGWGINGFTGNTLFRPMMLQSANLPIISYDECNVMTGGQALWSQTHQVCAYYPHDNIDACMGDSGGPLYLRVDGQYQLLGITSQGQPCSDNEASPGVYTRASAYIDWINQTIDDPTLRIETKTDASQPESERGLITPASGGGGGLLWSLGLLGLFAAYRGDQGR